MKVSRRVKYKHYNPHTQNEAEAPEKEFPPMYLEHVEEHVELDGCLHANPVVARANVVPKQSGDARPQQGESHQVAAVAHARAPAQREARQHKEHAQRQHGEREQE
jgi:hypothetical protein